MRSIHHTCAAALVAVVACVASVAARNAARPVDGGSVQGKFVSLERLKTKGDTSERDVVVYLREKTPTTHPAPTAPVVIKQERLIFKPHVLAVSAGTPISFENIDAVMHNVFSSDACCKVDLDMPASEKKNMVLAEPGVASIICRLHPDMSMYVVVLDNPFFQTIELQKQGGKDSDTGTQYTAEFQLPNVPPGEYVLTYWNKKLKPQEFPITVEAGKATTVDVTVAATN
jgi:plastocyanin